MKTMLFISLIILITVGAFLCNTGSQEVHYKGEELKFKSVITKKWENFGLHFELQNGPILEDYILDTDMQAAMIGDSLFKKEGENYCTIKHANGTTERVKFIYDE